MYIMSSILSVNIGEKIGGLEMYFVLINLARNEVILFSLKKEIFHILSRKNTSNFLANL